MNTKFQTVEEYIATFPPKTKKFLKDLRATIKQSAPQAEEAISYNMPAFKLHGMLVWYAGYKEHIGLYPRTTVIQAFKKDLEGYKDARFSHTQSEYYGLRVSQSTYHVLNTDERPPVELARRAEGAVIALL